MGGLGIHINKSQHRKKFITQHPSIMPKFGKGFRRPYSIPSNSMMELCQPTALESTIRLYESLNLNKQLSYKTFSSSVSCKVDLRPLESQYELKVDPTKGFSIIWREIG